MEEALKNGKDVLYIGFSSALSATYSIANMVAKELAAKYPKRKIYLVNSLCASLGAVSYTHLDVYKRQER